GLVGPSGGGKTTIVNLIARFYDVTGGAIRIDGVDVRRLETGHYRRQIGMVLQDPYLFHGTVLENIRYGLPAASLEQAVAAAPTASTLRKASRLFVIADGRVVESGTHAELVAKPDGKYRRLYEMQVELA